MHVNLGQADQFQDRNYPYLGSIVQYTSTLWNASKFNNKWEEKEEVLDSHECNKVLVNLIIIVLGIQFLFEVQY